ncbi:MAG: Asp-tRNA(Asn)/Glu-tRNA(Gln) amidotransferase subunit GatB [bacterium]|nr:Asp-tRNA(Asn)/Glu-tRNA(Gln) amidotransferase subunit GatB [bacterium]
MPTYTPTIGLEIHAELATTTKLFCDSKNDPDEKRPNVNVCPVCMGHPGTLPVLNEEALRHMIRIGLSIGGEIANFTEFDRKNYFYPDIPKGYQISQYKYPIVSGGMLRGIAVTRVHLEEDTARSQHGSKGESLVDFNRAGVSLMELVTEPVLHSAEEASAFARELQVLLRTLGASDAQMEKGQMRVEANVSVSSTEGFGTKVEVKNINSFRSVERAIKYEIERQTAVLQAGGSLVQETRGWDEVAQETFSQRSKEEAKEYRYFPEPDLPKYTLHDLFDLEDIRSDLPELPWVKRDRLKKELGFDDSVIELFVVDGAAASFFERATVDIKADDRKLQLASNYITSDLAGLLRASGSTFADLRVDPSDFAALIELISANKLSSRGAKDILATMIEEGGSPFEIAESRGLFQVNDMKQLADIAQSIVDEHPILADEYRAGKVQALQFFIGQGMKMTKGSANPKMLEDVFKKILG